MLVKVFGKATREETRDDPSSQSQVHPLQLPEKDSCPALLAEGKVSIDNTQLFSLDFQE